MFQPRATPEFWVRKAARVTAGSPRNRSTSAGSCPLQTTTISKGAVAVAATLLISPMTGGDSPPRHARTMMLAMPVLTTRSGDRRPR